MRMPAPRPAPRPPRGPPRARTWTTACLCFLVAAASTPLGTGTPSAPSAPRTKIEARWCPEREGAGETPVTCVKPEACPEERLLWTGGDEEPSEGPPSPRRVASCGSEGPEWQRLVCCLPEAARTARTARAAGPHGKRYVQANRVFDDVGNDIIRNQSADAGRSAPSVLSLSFAQPGPGPGPGLPFGYPFDLAAALDAGVPTVLPIGDGVPGIQIFDGSRKLILVPRPRQPLQGQQPPPRPFALSGDSGRPVWPGWESHGEQSHQHWLSQQQQQERRPPQQEFGRAPPQLSQRQPQWPQQQPQPYLPQQRQPEQRQWPQQPQWPQNPQPQQPQWPNQSQQPQAGQPQWSQQPQPEQRQRPQRPWQPQPEQLQWPQRPQEQPVRRVEQQQEWHRDSGVDRHLGLGAASFQEPPPSQPQRPPTQVERYWEATQQSPHVRPVAQPGEAERLNRYQQQITRFMQSQSRQGPQQGGSNSRVAAPTVPAQEQQDAEDRMLGVSPGRAQQNQLRTVQTQQYQQNQQDQGAVQYQQNQQDQGAVQYQQAQQGLGAVQYQQAQQGLGAVQYQQAQQGLGAMQYQQAQQGLGAVQYQQAQQGLGAMQYQQAQQDQGAVQYQQDQRAVQFQQTQQNQAAEQYQEAVQYPNVQNQRPVQPNVQQGQGAVQYPEVQTPPLPYPPVEQTPPLQQVGVPGVPQPSGPSGHPQSPQPLQPAAVTPTAENVIPSGPDQEHIEQTATETPLASLSPDGGQAAGQPGREPGARSSRMCERYSSQSGRQLQASSLLLGDAGPVSTSVDDCDNHTPLIVGGQNATENEFPHMAAIGFRSGDELGWLCGGSLISEQFVLTAAHCTHTGWGPPVVVRLGSVNVGVAADPADDAGVSAQPQPAQPLDVAVREVVAHPQYAPPARYHDIALVRLARPVAVSSRVRPACLPPADAADSLRQYPAPDSVAVATGWGRLSYAGDTSDALQKVSLRVWDWQACARTYPADERRVRLRQGLGPGMLCAGDPLSNRDTCQGDSGGPLQVRGGSAGSAGCAFRVLGITSFGRECGLGLPAVYTRVAHYIAWIEDVVWPEQ